MLHPNCFGDAIREAQDNLDPKNFYMTNPSFDKNCIRKMK